jgi:hypothetical protein
MRFRSQPVRSGGNFEHIKDDRLEPDEEIQHELYRVKTTQFCHP